MSRFRFPKIGQVWTPLDDDPDARFYRADLPDTLTTASSATRHRIGEWSSDLLAGEAYDNVDGQGIVQLASGRILRAGGSPTGHSAESVNTIWRSDDDGRTWAVHRAGVDRTAWDAGDASYKASNPVPGHTFPFFTHTISGTEWLYWFGGDTYNPSGNGYRSSDGGTTWTRITTACPTSALQVCNFGVLGEVFYLIGGHTTLTEATTVATNHVWKSTDYGFNWTDMGAAPWAARGMQLGKMPELNGKLWLVAGGVTNGTVSVDHLVYNDVWTFDGTDWEEVLADGNTELPRLRYHAVTLFKGNLWTINGTILREVQGGSTVAFASGAKTLTRNTGSWLDDGFVDGGTVNVRGTASNDRSNAAITALTDLVMTLGGESITDEAALVCDVTMVDSDTLNIQWSNDGATWNTWTDPVPYSDTHAGAAIGLDDVLVFTHGFQNGFAYAIREHTGPIVSAWLDQGSDGLDLEQATSGARPIYDSAEFNGRGGVVFTKSQFLALAAKDATLADGFFEAWAVVKSLSFDASGEQAGVNPNCVIVGATDASSWNNFGLQGADGALRYIQVDGGYQASDTTTDGYNDDAPRLLGVVHEAGSIKFYVGTTMVYEDTTDVGFDATHTGWDAVGAGYLEADKAEMVVGMVLVRTTGAVSDESFISKLATFASRWGT